VELEGREEALPRPDSRSGSGAHYSNEREEGALSISLSSSKTKLASSVFMQLVFSVK